MCAKSYFQWRSLYNHYKKKHSNAWMCTTCLRKFHDRTLYVMHCDTSHGPYKWACTMCGLKVVTKAAMGRHVKRHHKGVSLKDSIERAYD